MMDGALHGGVDDEWCMHGGVDDECFFAGA